MSLPPVKTVWVPKFRKRKGKAFANSADTAPPPWLAAMADDLQPLGKALEGAMNAGDEAAMRGALKKISARMPDFLESTGLEAALTQQFTQALSEES